MCKEVFMTIPVVLYTLKDFYLLDSLDEKIEQMKSAGLFEKLNLDIIKKNLVKNDVEMFPKVLNVNNLLGSFQLLCLGFCLASLVFGLEILMESRCFKRFVYSGRIH